MEQFVTITGYELKKMCRLCLTSDSIMTDIFLYSSKLRERIVDVVMKCAPVKITPNDELPHFICQLCHNQLEKTNKFQMQAVQSEKTLLLYLQQLHASHKPSKPAKNPTILRTDVDIAVNREPLELVTIKSEPLELKGAYFDENMYCKEETSLAFNTANKMTIEMPLKCEVTVIDNSPTDFYANSECTDDTASTVEENKTSYEDTTPVDTETTVDTSWNGVRPRLVEVIESSSSVGKKSSSKKGARLKVKNLKPYQCDDCDKCFFKSNSLKVHKLTHTGEKPYKCDICNRCFIQSGNLRSHKRVHTGEKPYKCDICNKCFTQSVHLSGHKRVHSGEKPYSCDICNKSFNQSSTLRSHKLVHTGDRPYKCDVCNKCFTQSSNLRKHKLMHSSNKVHQCNICNKCFTLSQGLEIHKLQHTEENIN